MSSTMQENKNAYEELLKAAKEQPASTDFTGLRMAYIGSTDCRLPPDYCRTDRLIEAMENGDVQAETDAHGEVLERFYLDIFTHVRLTTLYSSQGNKEMCEYHGRFASGLIKSILASGDGRSYETAFTVIDVSEEYAVVNLLGLEVNMQRLSDHDGHRYDVLEVGSAETAGKVEMCFNIDLFIGKGLSD